MTKKNGTKRSLLMSAVALVLCFSMLVGSTFAWFTDSVTSSGNKIQAGKLDVQLLMDTGSGYVDISADTAPIFGAGSIAQDNNAQTLWEPGKTQVAYLAIKNNGSLALKYSVALKVDNVSKDLYKAMKYDIVEDATKANPVTAWTSGTAVTPGIQSASDEVSLAVGATHYFALAIHMDESAGNEYQNGEVNFDLTVLATQDTVEADSFGALYDENSEWPITASGSAPVVDGVATVIYVLDENNPGTDPAQDSGKIAVVTVPADAVATDAENIDVMIIEDEDYNFAVATEGVTRTFDVKVVGLKENNDVPVKVELFVGKGLTGVELYHHSNEITCAYNSDSGYVIFESATFSPFTVVYDAVAVEETPADPEAAPEAIVEDADEYENTEIEWSNSIGMMPGDSNQQLAAVYKFTAPHNSVTVEESAFRNWHCDYYVMLESATLDTLPEGYITLAGNYGTWGWVGFDNPEVDTNTWIPLLGSVTENPWTYEMVVDFVEEFICGVGKTNAAGTALNGAKFMVQLRLTNPDNANEYYVCAEVTYAF